MDEEKREVLPSPPESDLWRLTPGAVERVLNSLGVRFNPCRECGAEDGVIIDCPDPSEGVIPRIASYELTDDGRVALSKGFFLPVVNLSCSRCGFIRTFVAYNLILRLNEIEGSQNSV
jgi:hypothetical protein